MVFGGMMVGKVDIPRLIGRFQSTANFIYSAGLFLRYLTDRLRYSRGTRLMMGNALVGRMYHSLLQLDLRPQFDTRLDELVMAAGVVTGARNHRTIWLRFGHNPKGCNPCDRRICA